MSENCWQWPANIEKEQQRGLLKLNWQELIAKHLLTQENPPRWILLLGNRQALMIDRTKWAQNRLLRFDFAEILGRKETDTLKAASVLLHKDSLMPGTGQPLLDTLDEGSHKHAFSVSEDLKYALRESIELLGNEATRYLIDQGKAQYSGKNAIRPDQLSLECLRYMYRLLFLFYIEARPELEYAPNKSMTYLKGYSLETLRDLEMVPLYNETDRNGRYLHDSLNLLFRLIHQGYSSKTAMDTEKLDTFSIRKLDSHLFAPKQTPTLNKVVFTNETLQRIIQLMSLTRTKPGTKSRRGRISYAQLGINQLGAVYEALLSYKGFFASQDLYEVKKKGETVNELDIGYFVTAQQFEQYHDDEKVTHTVIQGGEKKTRYKKRLKGSFIYRMAGRDREKSASYYTPEVLTQALVKYALKELFDEKIAPLTSPKAKAAAIIRLTVCEPAMGSAAFLNEAINQLAEHYLFYQQQAENRRINQDDYTRQLQRVKMYIADNNVFGVDLNPVAVELAEVSLWLNAISSEAFVPWFGYQLFNGNSLIGARRQVYSVHQLNYQSQKTPCWLNQPPQQPGAAQTHNGVRADDEVYHFLLGDNGMANYPDKVVKGLKTDAIKALYDWRKDFNQPYSDGHKSQLLRISQQIDDLWQQHIQSLSKNRHETTDQLPIWPNTADALTLSNMASKDQQLNSVRMNGSSAYFRLKMVMNYWCALWFWPIDKVDELPDRDDYLFDIETLLAGDIQPETVDLEGDGDGLSESNEEAAGETLDMFADALHQETQKAAEKIELLTGKGELNKKVIFKYLPRLALADELFEQYRFFHWPLEFADIFAQQQGFDLVLGNPPWLKVEWQEGGILGDHNPLLVLRKVSAPKMNELREQTLEQFPALQTSYFTEYVEAQGSQNFLNATVNYPLLKGIQTNLYKCFLPQAWMISNNTGVSGFLHPEGNYDDPKGGVLRQQIYPRLRAHYQFHNEEGLFAEVHHATTYSINIYGGAKPAVAFKHLANLFIAKTIDECFNHSGEGLTPGLKDIAVSPDGKVSSNWGTQGHYSRIINIDHQSLSLFASLYDAQGTPALSARLPALHSQQLLSVLEKFADQPKRLGDIKECYMSTVMFDETYAQKDGTIKRSTQRPTSISQWVLSGPHFFVATPCYKTPKAVCKLSSDYDTLDLTNLPDDYLPRTNYIPACNETEYLRRTPKVPWLEAGESEPKPVTDYYRLTSRTMIGPSSERTLISAIIQKQVAHIDLGFSILFKQSDHLPLMA
ncbi:MAG: hypothetical protein ACI8WB_006114, partial [Phenylobacterium sp.]